MPHRLGTRPAGETLLAAALTATGLVEAVLGLTSPPAPWPMVASVGLVTVPVVWMRRAPQAALTVAVLAMVAQALLGSDLGGGFSEPIALGCLLFGVGARLPLGRAAALAAGTWLGLGAVMALSDGSWSSGTVVYSGTVVALPWGFGRVVRLAEERNALLHQRAALMEKEAERRAADVAAAERTRLARELHDVVTHNLSAIVVQSGAERRALGDGAPSGPVLASIEDHGRQTLQELRRLLGVLRAGDDCGTPLAPQPGLADLPALVQSHIRAGGRIEWEVDGSPRPVARGLELAVFRIVQESLTNATKHAPGAAVQVCLCWTDDSLDVDVRQDGAGRGEPPMPGTGAGLRGIHERVLAYGGRLLHAGPTADGFRVQATFPLNRVRDGSR